MVDVQIRAHDQSEGDNPKNLKQCNTSLYPW
jgi:hypothetical protein